jgi:hypothetical protein
MRLLPRPAFVIVPTPTEAGNAREIVRYSTGMSTFS